MLQAAILSRTLLSFSAFVGHARDRYQGFAPASTSDISYAQPSLDEVSIPSSQHGRPRKRCKWLLADKGYDAEALHR